MSDQFIAMSVAEDEVQPFLDGLFAEYNDIYGDFFEKQGQAAAYQRNSHNESERYDDPNKYLPPHGLFIVLKRHGQIIAMGAYKRYDHETAELKRIWSHHQLRKQGLAGRVVRELEQRAYQAGYKKVYLTTGFLQIPAVKLYLSLGYQPQFEITADFNFDHYIAAPFNGGLPFIKTLQQEAVA